ncbi:MAG: Rrf2 family transcriptional regulator [Firmicutes bacterium]|jgi:Rrf2 family cysteine metabolism transcriptional repressor|nr:Rrf2 family transcriptional regulator [Bacillota bacterium]
MFRISSKGRYAVKAVYELALHADRGPLTVANIAQAQNIPEQYLEQLMPLLKRAGIVHGMRGAQGGYRLANRPEEVSVRDVVAAVEGPILVADCASDSGQGCQEMQWCIGPDVWVRVQEAVDEAMREITMDRLMREQRAVAKRSVSQLKASGEGG